MQAIFSGILGGVVLCTLGCGRSPEGTTADKEGSLFKKLVLNYGEIVRKNQGKLPKSQEALSSEFQTLFSDYLTKNQMNVQQLLTSPRDGKPYVFMTQANVGKGTDRIAGYEQIGANGMRYVGLRSGDVFEVDELGFRDLVPGR